MAKKKTVKKNTINQHILNVITPAGGIDYDDTHMNLADNCGQIFYISKYPADGGEYGWLAPLCNLEGTCTVCEYRYSDASGMTQVFNKRISDLKVDRSLAKEQSERERLDRAIDDLQELIHRIVVNQEPVGYVNIMFFVQSTDEKTYVRRLKSVRGNVQLSGCNMRILKYKQLPALECISPYGIPNRLVSNMGDRNMPISSFFGGFPMANTGIQDEGGYYLGKAKNNKLIILNMWLRGGDRTNGNWFISGIPGTGKSTFIKLLYMMEYAYGSRIIIFDPEREYQDIAKDKDMNGDIIDCAGGTTGRINPLQIGASPVVTEEDLNEGESLDDYFVYADEGHGMSDMALHIQNIRMFFKLYFGDKDFDSAIKTILEQCLIEVYEQHGITWDTDVSKLKPEQFPVLREVYDCAKEHAKDPENSAYLQNTYDRLCTLLYSAAYGADQFLWNGPTTLGSDSDFVVLNASQLLEMDDNLKRAQLYSLSTWTWHQMSADRTSRVIAGFDEGYLFVDPEYPDLLKFVRNISKRDRKYEGSLVFITHSVVDVLDPSVRRYGQAIIDNACYKFIMGCDGKNLKDTQQLFNLTEEEVNILAAKRRGTGILFAGSVRLEAEIKVRESFLKRMGNAGGR